MIFWNIVNLTQPNMADLEKNELFKLLFCFLFLIFQKSLTIWTSCSPNQKRACACTHAHTHTKHLFVRPLAVAVLAVLMSAIPTAFAPLPTVLALIVIFSLLLVYDLHLQAANVERYCAEPEEGNSAHCGALKEQGRHGEKHHPAQADEAADIRGTAKWHTKASQDEKSCITKNKPGLLSFHTDHSISVTTYFNVFQQHRLKWMNFPWSEKNPTFLSSHLGKCALKHAIAERNPWWCHKGHDTSPGIVARPAMSLICGALCVFLSLKHVQDPTKEVKLWL